MDDSIYRQLADRLDLIPNGFARTESGVELRILQKLFTPEQAALATRLRLRAEAAARIARRAGMPLEETQRLLTQMVDDGLIRAEPAKNGQNTYGLLPFVVGIYELNLHRMDAELAALMEAYFIEAAPTTELYRAPAVHRIIPVEETIDFDLEVHPHEQASALVNEAKAWAVRDCICRVQRGLIGKACQHPVETCLLLSPDAAAFDDVPAAGGPLRPITRHEALEVLSSARRAGLVHTTGNYRDGHQYICNCCTCSCGILRGVSEFALPTAIAHSNYQAVVDAALCSGCEDCVGRCQFGAVSIVDGTAVVDEARCLGCGQCAYGCTSDAIALMPRPRADREPLPTSLMTWMLRKGARRGMSFVKVY